MSRIAICSWGLLVAVALALSGCGGGGDDMPPPTFEIGARVNGQEVLGVDVLPGTTQTITIPVGQSFELYSLGPVSWTVLIGGSEVPGVDNTILFGGATIQETLTTSSQFTASTWADSLLPIPVAITLVATSLIDAHEVATVDVILTN